MGLELSIDNAICWLLIFFANVIIDVFAVKFVLQVVDINPLRAGLMSVGITLINSLSLIFIIEYSHWYIFPTILGAFCGTFGALKDEKSKIKTTKRREI